MEHPAFQSPETSGCLDKILACVKIEWGPLKLEGLFFLFPFQPANKKTGALRMHTQLNMFSKQVPAIAQARNPTPAVHHVRLGNDGAGTEAALLPDHGAL